VNKLLIKTANRNILSIVVFFCVVGKSGRSNWRMGD